MLNEILLVGASQGLLLVVVILSLRSANPAAKRMLALFVALESMHLLALFAMYSREGQAPVPLLRLVDCMRVLAVPALYLYVRAMTEQPFWVERRQLRHLWVVLPVLAWFFGLSSSSEWLDMSTKELQLEPSTLALSSYVSLVFIGYGLAALRQLNTHSQRLEQALSSVEHVSLWWLRGLILLVITVNGVHLVFDGLRLTGGLGPESKLALNTFSTLLVVYLISIGGLRQPAVFTKSVREALAALNGERDEDERGRVPQEPLSTAKYAKSGLDDSRIEDIDRALTALMIQQRPFLDPALDLPILADRLGVRPQELSQVINTQRGCNFYEMINGARVEEAKSLLRSPEGQGRKMLDIAISVGFSSQSTFYNQFKKQTGQTPSAYRNRMASVPAET